ncbi:MAG: sulfotransferase domain-containing protein [Rhizomicrobium sp.]
MESCAIIATHHKTGTVWMDTIFRRIGKALGLRFVNIKKSVGLARENLTVPSIIFNDHSEFKNCSWLLEHPSSRILHLIRDPRDIVLSAMNYHRTATERWLHKRRREFDGQSYQEKLNSLPDDRSRYMFEMNNSAQRIIQDMRRWDYGRANSIECRYEELVDDVDLVKFDMILSHLGFDTRELDACHDIIRKNSLFGAVTEKKRGHIRSGQARQWEARFDGELAAEFLSRFGDVLIELGYETDNSWADALQAPPRRVVRTPDAVSERAKPSG